MATEAVLETLRQLWLVLRQNTAEALGFEVQVLGCEDLILLKLLAGRIIDRADAAMLLRANIAVIDEDLLNRLTARLDLTGAVAEIRREAFE